MLHFLASQWPHLIPAGAQVVQAAILLAVAAGLTAIGAALRLAGGGERTMPAADLVVGWGVVAALFIITGCFTAIPFSALLAPTGAAMAAAGVMLVRRRESLLPPGGGRMLLLLLPLLLIGLSMLPSESDDFGQWLPNLRYLMRVDHFPGPGMPVSDSGLPGYPYALTLVAWAVGQIAGGIAETAVDKFNLLLLAALALVLVGEFRGAAGTSRPGWAATGIALAAVTLLSPTFVIKLALSNYADVATSVGLALSAVLAARMLESEEAPGRGLVIQAAACFAILILVKQANLGLLALTLGGLALWVRRTPLRLLRLVVPLAAAAAAYLAWRHQVRLIGGGEQVAVPLAQYQFAVLPKTLASIGHVIVNKGGYFGLGLVLCIAAAPALLRRPVAGQGVLAAWPAAFLGFTLFLIWVYLAVYIGYEGESAASFWRYHTQLGGMQLVAAAGLAGPAWRKGEARLPRLLPRALAALCLAIVVAGPVVAAREVRFDLHPVKLHVRAAALDMAPLLTPGQTVILIDHRGPAFFSKFMEYYLGFGRQMNGVISDYCPPGEVAPTLAQSTATYAYVLTSSPAVDAALGQALAPDSSHLLQRTDGGRWRLVRSWRFEGFRSPTDYKY